MGFWDRVGRSVFVALAVGLGWGIRGDFGHNLGASYPGAALGLAFAFVSGQRALFRWMPIIAALSAVGIATGGTMSYGVLHGYAQSDTLLNYSYGYLTLFLQGAAWGTFGGALVGLMLERRPMETAEWFGLLGTIFMAGWLGSFFVVDVLGFEINPPRNNISISYMCAAIGQFIWLVWNRRSTALRGAFLGYVGFGIGMAGGRLLGNLANVLQEPLGFTINHWNVMEVSCGWIGGFIFCFGMVNRRYPEPPQQPNITLASVYGVLYVLGLIPLWHRLARIDPEEKLVAWADALRSSGYARPEEVAETILLMLDAVCVLGFVGAFIWLFIHLRDRGRWAAFPVLWLSLTMLLFQNLNGLTYFTPWQPGNVNMHYVFWVIFGLMLAYVAFARPKPATEADGSGAKFPYVLAIAGTIAVFGLIIVLAGVINGEVTMASANTRWPIWNWRDGPFPGRSLEP